MSALPVNEIFDTMQGEATFTGTPSLFIRLQGCDVGCPWCDTKHTWKADPEREVSFEKMSAKVVESSQYANATIDDLLTYAGPSSKHVVITGGEPCVHDLRQLTGRLHGIAKSVQIETSGTSEIKCHDRTWVTLSPKINMPGGLKVRVDAMERADEIKMPVGKMADVELLVDLLEQHGTHRCYPNVGLPRIWLQPLSTSTKATELCMAEARKRSWRVSIQTHKFLGVR